MRVCRCRLVLSRGTSASDRAGCSASDPVRCRGVAGRPRSLAGRLFGLCLALCLIFISPLWLFGLLSVIQTLPSPNGLFGLLQSNLHLSADWSDSSSHHSSSHIGIGPTTAVAARVTPVATSASDHSNGTGQGTLAYLNNGVQPAGQRQDGEWQASSPKTPRKNTAMAGWRMVYGVGDLFVSSSGVEPHTISVMTRSVVQAPQSKSTRYRKNDGERPQQTVPAATASGHGD